MHEQDSVTIQKVGNGYLITYAGHGAYQLSQRYDQRIFVVRSESELLKELPGIMAEPMKGFIHPTQEATLDDELVIPAGV